jgi:hypothetical protein
VACILTQHCWYDIFCKILDAFQDTACSDAGALGVATFARNLQAQGLVAPGSAVRMPLEGLRELYFVRPLNTSKCHYDARLCELFRRLPVSKTVSTQPNPHKPPSSPCAEDFYCPGIILSLCKNRSKLQPRGRQPVRR